MEMPRWRMFGFNRIDAFRSDSAVRTLMSRVAGSVVDLLLPMRCVVCEREGRYLCDGCEPSLPRLKSPYCRVCAAPKASPLCHWCAATPPAIDGIRAPYLMEGAVRRMVHELKYRNLRAAASTLGRLMARYLESRPMDVDALVTVPLHGRRERQRGYNQSEILARALAKHTGVPLRPHVLRRTRNTAPQVFLNSDDDRRRNVVGAFECTNDMGGGRVLLVDDVVTTGSTMSACAAALKDAGVSHVWGLALARQP